ncbi:MAG: apolipoprotein N-acyltransferase [Rikenellaceae bacterium]
MRSKKFLAVAISIVTLSIGWLGITGLTLLVALVPLLWISHKTEDSRRGWWSMFGYALLAFVGWNLSTIWWIGYATPVGPFAATLASSFYSIVAFMIFHTISKRAPKALAYTALTSIWIAFEYNYTVSEFSWPWLLLGNGFSNDIWAIQWYEYTGIFGGSLWVLLSNILLFEAVISTKTGVRRWLKPALMTSLPLAVSLLIYATYEVPQGARSMEVTVIQPNVDCYDKFAGTDRFQEDNIIEMLHRVPKRSELILLPETSVPRYYDIESYHEAPFFTKMVKLVEARAPKATLICGSNSVRRYADGEQSETARDGGERGYYDLYNSAVAVRNNIRLRQLNVQVRNKARLVIGVENTPSWVFKVFRFFVIDIGGVVGQIGKGTTAEPFIVGKAGVNVGGAICYEGLYGNFIGEFVRGGAELLTIISNDGWWGNTPGHKHLYSLSQVRAVEHRRYIARSANTGVSGFINSRGDNIESLGWQERGALTQEVKLSKEMTIYTQYGDYIARVMCFVALLSILYFVAYRARKRHYLVS